MRISDWSSDVFSSDRADRVFGVGIHLAEGLVAAIGQEDGIVAEPLVAARRTDERAVDTAFEPFDMAVGPGERERAAEMRVAAGVEAGVAQPGFERAHRFLDWEDTRRKPNP